MTSRKRAAPVIESEASDDSDRSATLIISFCMHIKVSRISDSSIDKPALGSPANIQPSPKKKAKPTQASPSTADVNMRSDRFVLLILYCLISSDMLSHSDVEYTNSPPLTPSPTKKSRFISLVESPNALLTKLDKVGHKLVTPTKKKKVNANETSKPQVKIDLFKFVVLVFKHISV